MTDIIQTSAPQSVSVADFIQNNTDVLNDESLVIAAILADLSATKTFVSNKDIISALLVRLELETDALNQDILRKALEVVVQKTPDDAI